MRKKSIRNLGKLFLLCCLSCQHVRQGLAAGFVVNVVHEGALLPQGPDTCGNAIQIIISDGLQQKAEGKFIKADI